MVAGEGRVVALDLEWTPLDLEAKALKEIGISLEEHHCRTDDDVIRVARDAVGILTEIAPLSKRALQELKLCRVIAEFGVGTDYIDLDTAASLGMYVTNVPDYCTGEVADHTLALALALLRRLFEQRDLVRTGTWNSLAAGSVARLEGSIWGIIGFGRIGRAVAERVHAFGTRVVVYDPYLSTSEIAQCGATPLPLHEVLHQADVVSIHAPKTTENLNLIGRREFSLMKRSAILINVSRGALVDEAALKIALDSEALGGAGLDVLQEEPPSLPHILIDHPRVIVTPHMGWYSENALVELRSKGIASVVDVLCGRVPRYVVARPQ